MKTKILNIVMMLLATVVLWFIYKTFLFISRSFLSHTYSILEILTCLLSVGLGYFWLRLLCIFCLFACFLLFAMVEDVVFCYVSYRLDL